MLQLTKVSHEHHEQLWRYVNELYDIADCLDSDCLDTPGLTEGLPRLRDVYAGLTTQLIPHMEAVEAAVYPTLERLVAEEQTTVPMAEEHQEIRRLVAALGVFIEDDQPAHRDRAAVLALRRVLLRLHTLLRTHLSEEELYIPILEDRLTEPQEAALARALDHLATERL
jgi:iron-sulfur cluster repair protein YtfE (RIC family)